jgi:serine/threonine-protein kinase
MTSTPGNSDSRQEPDLSGRLLGDYQFLRRLGRGGMAEVYLAEQRSLRRQVAIKVLRQNLSSDETYVRRFHHEAQAAAKLVHGNIVTIHEVGCAEGWHYIAQEYVPGQNLKQLLGRNGRGLEAVQAVTIMRQVAAALGKAAEQNITHRDIKPENIMLASSGEVKVADFGLARVAQSGEALNLTQAGITMGTPLYMSPEQAEGKEVDPRSDLYSLGVTSYHMLSGRPPFDGETALAVAVQHLKTEPTRLEILRPDLPEGLCRIVHKLLAKQPGERYQKAAELLKDLRSLQIPGMDGELASESAHWDGTNGGLTFEGRLAATQQLSRLMQLDERRSRSSWPASRYALVLTGLAVLGMGAGAAAAWLNRPAELLQSSAGASKVPKLGSAEEQFFYAQMATRDQEEAWKAVALYFPPGESPLNKRYARLATKGLANYYLSNNQLREARPLYEELASIDLSSEPNLKQLHIAGLAGCAVVAYRLDDKLAMPIYMARFYAFSDEEIGGIGQQLEEALQEVLEDWPRPAAE